MTTITVKNIPEDLYMLLKETAAANHRSINSEIIACIERSVRARPVDIDEFLERARELRELTADYVITDDKLTEAKNTGRP